MDQCCSSSLACPLGPAAAPATAKAGARQRHHRCPKGGPANHEALAAACENLRSPPTRAQPATQMSDANDLRNLAGQHSAGKRRAPRATRSKPQGFIFGNNTCIDANQLIKFVTSLEVHSHSNKLSMGAMTTTTRPEKLIFISMPQDAARNQCRQCPREANEVQRHHVAM